MLDEFQEEWIFIAMMMPSVNDNTMMLESLDSLADSLNARSCYALWINVENDSDNSSIFTFMTGFTIKKSNWSLTTDKYASYSMQQLHAFGSYTISDDDYSSKTLTRIISDSMSFSNQSTHSPESIIAAGLNGFMTKLSKRLQSALSIQYDRDGFKFKLPLKDSNSNSDTTLSFQPMTHKILGSGLLVSANLPGALPKNQSVALARKLNLGTDDDVTVHTTPKLMGSWSTKTVGDFNEMVSMSYNGFIPFAEPANFTISEQIEGVVREIYVSWPTFNEQVRFNNITKGEYI
jgi:hypothetical protein